MIATHPGMLFLHLNKSSTAWPPMSPTQPAIFFIHLNPSYVFEDVILVVINAANTYRPFPKAYRAVAEKLQLPVTWISQVSSAWLLPAP